MAGAGRAQPVSARRSGDHGFCRPFPRSLPKILRRIRETADAVIAAKPDVLVIIDSPEFTHRVARTRARPRRRDPDRRLCLSLGLGLAAGARARHARPMSIMCWRCCRSSRRRCNSLRGPPCTFVGHPLERAGRRVASECRRGAPAPGRSAAAAGAAGQPIGRDPPHGRRVRRMPLRCWPNAPGRLRSWCRRCRGLPTAVRAAVASWRVAGARGDRTGREARRLPHRRARRWPSPAPRRSNWRLPAFPWSPPTRFRCWRKRSAAC